MAHIFSITDGLTTQYLTPVNGYIVTDADMGTAESGQNYIDNEPEIVDTLDVVIKGTSGPNMQSLVYAVQGFLARAKLRQVSKTGPRIYFQFQVDGDSNVNRAEITDGDFRPIKESYSLWGANVTQRELTIQHGAWYGPRVEIPLASATSGTPATGGKPITNGANNWVQIAVGAVGGTLPTPVELVLTNTAGTSVSYRNFYLANNAWSDPANFTHTVEGEARLTGYGTITANGTCSGGNYNNYSFTNTGEIHWALSSTLMQQTRGRDFKLLARFFNWTGTDIFVQPILRDDFGLLPLAYGDEYRLPAVYGTQIIDLDSLPLPNGEYYSGYIGTTLCLALKATGAASVGIDFIQLFPVADHGYQHVVQRGYSIINGTTITFDNIERLYHSDGASVYAPHTGLLRVWPGIGTPQRILILTDEGTSSTITRPLTVRAYIRERRLTI